MKIRFIHALTGAAVCVAALSGTAARAQTSAHAMVVSGQASHAGGGTFACATSGPQPGVFARFGTGNGLPTEGYSYCGLAGGIVDNSSATGVSAAHVDLGPGHPFNNGLHLQASDATADFGVLKASSSGSYTGDPGGGFLYAQGEGAAVSTDTLPTPTGADSIQFGFTIDGSASVAKTSQVIILFNYQINSEPIFTIFHASLLGDTALVQGLDEGGAFVDLAGFTVAVGSVSGSDTVFTFRTKLPSSPTFDLTLGLYAGSYPSPLGGIANADFSETVRLSSIETFDASGRAFNFGSIIGASGRIYDATGVHTAVVGAPEPSTWAMMLLGFAGLGYAAVRRSRRPAIFA